MEFKVIVTGATGMVGEGVLLECLDHQGIKEVLMVNRRHFNLQHPKLKELIVPDFNRLDEYSEHLEGYDACFYCAGVSSVGMDEKTYSYITLDITLFFANILVKLNPDMIFNYVSGSQTDSSEKGRIMWARVKGKTENALLKLPFRNVYCFRPGLIKPVLKQRNVKFLYKTTGILYGLFKLLIPAYICTMHEVGLAMINVVQKSYPKNRLEVADIKILTKK